MNSLQNFVLSSLVVVAFSFCSTGVWGQGFGRWFGLLSQSPFPSKGQGQVTTRLASGTGGSDAYLSQSSQCCNLVQFSGSDTSQRCFDLKQCEKGGSSGGINFGWTFDPQTFGSGGSSTFDFEGQKMCACMAGATRGGQKIGRLCCSSKYPTNSGPTFGELQPEPPKTNTASPTIHFDDGPRPKPQPSSPPSTRPSQPQPLPIPPVKDDASIHSVEWNLPTKALVRSHPNLRLLPGLDSCGQAKARSGIVPYIIGGVNSKLGHHPWMTRLGILSPDPEEGLSFACGGTLINERYVLTAAHCVSAPPLPPGYKLTTVRLGEFDQRQDPDCDARECAPSVQDITVEQIVSHPAYSLSSHENDIALLRLAAPAALGSYVTPICLPVHDFHRMGERPSTTLRLAAGGGDQLTVAGWGRTRFDKEDGSDVLQEVKVPIVTRRKCQDYFRELFGVIKDGRFCSGGEMSRDSCRGDSGGPIMGQVALKPANGASSVTRMVQLGIVSIGREDAQCSMAGEGHLTLYTKVAHYLPWILDQIRP